MWKKGIYLLLVATVGAGSYFLGSVVSQKPEENTSPSITDQPTPGATPSASTNTNPGELYLNETYGYQMSFPLGWKLEEKMKTAQSGNEIYTKMSGETGWIQINIGNQPLETGGATPPSVRETNLNLGGVDVKATEVVNKDETGYFVAQLEQNQIQFDIRAGNTGTKEPKYDRDKEQLLKILSTFKFTK